MINQEAYNLWAEQYDSNKNLTRDLEGVAMRKTLSGIDFHKVLEIACGTGKNSEYFVRRAEEVLSVDFSEEMLQKAMKKITAQNIRFKQADVTQEWNFTTEIFDLISFSLVLEHIQDLDFVFKQLRTKINKGHVYIGELHPFKQYQGSVARFDVGADRIELECYTHNISEFLAVAADYGFVLVELKEWFDEHDWNGVPRILTVLFRCS
jgi:2-polyprenyl-3-methyl-5-hydroxy-6-metoxy-1,4-benzoquinol methylase